jgi:carboxyl-terminal processing protease
MTLSKHHDFGRGCVLGFLLGVVLSLSVSGYAQNKIDTVFRKLAVFAEVLTQIENHYVGHIEAQDLIYAANRGMVDLLDEHSEFYEPKAYRSLHDETQGMDANIGLVVAGVESSFEVQQVWPRSPAQRADIRQGDQLRVVDKVHLIEQSPLGVAELLKGPVGSTVTLKVWRSSKEVFRIFTLSREPLSQLALEHRRLPEGRHYIKLKLFRAGVADDLENLLFKMKPKALILDLRDNPGGLFEEAVAVADLFLRQGMIVKVRGKAAQKWDKRYANTRSTFTDYPMVVWINQGTASSSEIVAAALKEHKRAHLIGSKSFGKGSIQTLIDLSDGSGLKLTIGHYFSPQGKFIEGRGVVPDEELAQDKAKDGPLLKRTHAWFARHD